MYSFKTKQFVRQLIYVFPKIISKKVIPIDHTSLFVEYGQLSNSYGAIYRGVPTNSLRSCLPRGCIFVANPKSAILNVFLERRMFSGLISLCM